MRRYVPRVTRMENELPVVFSLKEEEFVLLVDDVGHYIVRICTHDDGRIYLDLYDSLPEDRYRTDEEGFIEVVR